MKLLKWFGFALVAIIVLFFIMSFNLGTPPDANFMSGRLNEIERYFVFRDLSNEEVSTVDVAWQLDHTLKAINNITIALENSNPADYQINFNLSRTFVFTRGDFPRGVAQAPASVIPPAKISNQALLDQLKIARDKLPKMHDLDQNCSYNHDVFGLLNRDQTARLIEVHTDHHLKIIRDILKAEGVEDE